MNAYRVVVADDHTMLRQGVMRIIEESKDLTVIGEAGDGLELLNLLKKVRPDMVVLDISMPNMRGIEAVPEIKMIHPEARILMLSMHKQKEYLYEAFSAGAHGYLLKEDTDLELITAIEKIRSGFAYLSPTLSEYLTNDLINICRNDKKPLSDPLTNREREVLKLIAEGKSNKEAAGLLFISTKTVEHHRARIMKKLGLKNITELVKYAIQKKYTSSDI